MRWCAELKRIVKATELFAHYIFWIARDFKRLFHNIDSVVADSARAQLDSVANYIVLICFDFQRSLCVERFKPALRHREGVVREDNLAGVRVLLEEREVYDPAEFIAILLANIVSHVVCDICSYQPGKPMAFIDRRGHEEERIAWLHADDRFHFFELFRGEEFCDRSFELAFFGPANIPKALAAVFFDIVFAFVEPGSCFDTYDSFY